MEKFIVETSARHVHLSKEDVEILFGKGATLTHVKELSQPNQYVCEERVDIVGPKNTIKRVVILAPTRPNTQVEVSLTDARSLGLNVPVRESGDIKDSAVCKLVGPCGEVELTEGLIVAKRHIHTTPADAKKLNVNDKEVVCVKLNSPQRTLILDDVVVRVSDSFNTAMHIDTDEANAAGVSGEVYGEIIKL